MSAFTPRRLAVALALSLGVNLFMAGFFVARGLRGRDAGAVAAMGSPRALMGAARRAGAHKQARRVMHAHRPELRARRDAMRDAQRRARGALGARSFDAQQLDGALREVRMRTGDSQASLHQVLVQLASELSQEQRAALADAIGRGRRGEGKRRRGE